MEICIPITFRLDYYWAYKSLDWAW